MAAWFKMALTLGIAFLIVAPVSAFWRLQCEDSLAIARLDPMMSYGMASEHAHTIKGGSAFSSTSTYSDLLQSNCTSCQVNQDLSAYWAPPLYFVHANGMKEVVKEKPPFKAYYNFDTGYTHDGKPQKVEAFPNGFQMIAGDNYRRGSSLPNPDPKPLGPWPNSSQELRAERATGFNCLHYNKQPNEGTFFRHSIPEKSFLDEYCTDGLRLELMFPSCWNGEMDGGSTFKSNLAYPDGVNVGNCPQGFDRRLVGLMYETIFATERFKGVPGSFVLANGDPTGYGYHGDFIAAWKNNALERAVAECNFGPGSSGMMKDCPVFQLNDPRTNECHFETPLPAAIATEKTHGPMASLPNNIQIFAGPGRAPKPVRAEKVPVGALLSGSKLPEGKSRVA